MATTSTKRVRILGTGLDSKSAKPYVDMPTEELEKLLLASIEHLKNDPTIDFDICWLSLSDEKPADALAKQIREHEPYDGVMIGWGVRGTPELSWLLEDCVEAVRDNAPATTRYLFSQTPSDHLETVYRKFPHAKPDSEQTRQAA